MLVQVIFLKGYDTGLYDTGYFCIQGFCFWEKCGMLEFKVSSNIRVYQKLEVFT